jgi:hypothetical protein
MCSSVADALNRFLLTYSCDGNCLQKWLFYWQTSRWSSSIFVDGAKTVIISKIYGASCVAWLPCRVARWCIFRPKIGIWVNFGESCKVTWCILWTFGLFYGHFIYFMDICYILWNFCLFFPVLVFFTKKNLATLLSWNRLKFIAESETFFVRAS